MPRKKPIPIDYPSGKELRGIRTVLGITQSELAYMLGVDQKSISYWETGRPIRSRAHQQMLADFRDHTMNAPDIDDRILHARMTLLMAE